VHGIGDVDADELRRKCRQKKSEYIAQRPVQRCGVDGCEFQTKHKRNLKDHKSLKHGIGDVDAEELRRKQKERDARRPTHRCGVDNCEFQTKYKSDLTRHRARLHGIGDVEAIKQRDKRRRATRPKRSDEMDFDTANDTDEHEVVAAAPRSRRARSAVDYAALAGVHSDASDAEYSAFASE
jgi:hypothetical protein